MPTSIRCALCPIKFGACLDLLRYAGTTLERATRGVSEQHLVLWQSEEIVAGTDDRSSVALAGDLIALALRTIGDLSQGRMAAIPERPEAAASAANENASGLEARAAAFVAENRERARPTALDPNGVWRLLPMAGTTALVVAIEFLEAGRRPESETAALPPGLAAVLQSVRERSEPRERIGRRGDQSCLCRSAGRLGRSGGGLRIAAAIAGASARRKTTPPARRHRETHLVFPGPPNTGGREGASVSVYSLKPNFQRWLRPLVRRLAEAGVTANQVTIAAALGSLAVGAFVAAMSPRLWPFLLVPIWLFVRMALNAIDGMLAREHGQKSPLGAYLNELGDVVSDAALYAPFALLPAFGAFWIGLVVVLAALTELAGVLGTDRRRFAPLRRADGEERSRGGLRGAWSLGRPRRSASAMDRMAPRSPLPSAC